MVDHILFTPSVLLENSLNVAFRNQSILDCDPEEGTERNLDEEAFDDIEDLWGSIALNKIKGNALLSLQHSVKRDRNFDEICKALEDKFDNGEDDDDMIENLSVNNEREATNNIKSDQDTLGSNHEAIGRNERIDTVIDSVMSEEKLFMNI